MKKFIFMLAGALFVLPALAEEPAATGAGDSTAAMPAAEGKPMTTKPAAKQSPPEVARATFTTAIDNREPVDKITNLPTDKKKIYYFTDLRNMSGKTVKHRWEYNGKVMAEVAFDIGGPRWRTFSSKNLDPSWKGEWKVSVIDDAGNTLSVNTFTYKEDQAEAAAGSESEASSPAPAGGEGKTGE